MHLWVLSVKKGIMDDKKIEEYEERLKNRHVERNYNFFKPVGQFIEHVDTINFSMDKDGTFHFENIGQVNGPESQNLTKGTVPIVREPSPEEEEQEGDKLPSAEEMVAACEKTREEALWWGNASWSVTYRIYCILGYKGNEESFMKEVKDWPFKKPFKYVCNRSALDRPLRRGRINGPLEKWAAEGASTREVKLGERLMEILS